MPQNHTRKDPTAMILGIDFMTNVTKVTYLHQTIPSLLILKVEGPNTAFSRKCIPQGTCFLVLASSVSKPKSGGRKEVGNPENEFLDSRKV